MRTDRFSVTRAAALLLACLLVPAILFAGGKSIQIWKFKIGWDSSTTKLAEALTPQIEEVQKGFEKGRGELKPVRVAGGKSAFRTDDLIDLVGRTRESLGKAIALVEPSKLAPLQAWQDEKLSGIESELRASSVRAAVPFPGFSTPRAVAVVASLEWLPLPRFASTKAVAPKQETVAIDKSSQLLDRVGKVVSQIFFLASNDKLEVNLWVGSTAPHTAFSFWSQGEWKGSKLAPLTIRTDGTRNHVICGLYSYHAAWSKGGVTHVIEYPNPAGAPAARIPSERLDLVNGSRFFCCRFGESYCHHVDNENDCRP